MTGVTNEQITAWGPDLSLSADALAQIHFMNESEPVRTVSSRRSVRGKYPSSIVQRLLQFESHKGELVFLWLAHYRWKCRLILDQPCWLRIEYPKDDGGKRAFDYPPDYFWIGTASADISSGRQAGCGDPILAEFIECKRSEKELEWAINVKENPKAQPWRYKKSDSGIWCSPPAQAAARKIGLGHRIFIAENTSPKLVNNIEFLADYFSEQSGNYNEAASAKFREVVAANPGIQIRAIIQDAKEGEIDTLYFMIARGLLFVDIDNEAIAPNHTARVFLDATLLEAKKVVDRAAAANVHDHKNIPELIIQPGCKVCFEGAEMTIVSVAGDVATLSGDNKRQVVLVSELEQAFIEGCLVLRSVPAAGPAGQFQRAAEIWKSLGPEELKVIFQRKALIEPLLTVRNGNAQACGRIGRNHYRWLANYRAAELRYGAGFGELGLRQVRRKGNCSRKLDGRVERILGKVMDKIYESKAAPNVEFIWGECLRLCKKHVPALRHPTRRTLYKRLAKRDQAKTVAAREGARSAYEFTSPYWDDTWDELSIDGEHAWALVHIDHTQMDIETPPTDDGLALGRPWLTVMVSPKHCRILAIAISYEPPSYRSCMAVIRECVSRHHRLPRIIVVDGGKEFESVYFEQLLARFDIIKKVRLPGRPRFGSVLERTNCTINSRLLHNLPGNTKLTKRVRILTADYHPDKLAKWPLGELREIVTEFAYDWLDTLPNRLTGISPRDLFAADSRMGGPRSHKIILPSRDFEMLTLPSTKSGIAKVRRREGVIIHRIPYWCGRFRDHRLTGKQFPVRYDPHDFSVIHLLIDGQWIDAHCRRFQRAFLGLTEPEVHSATTELLAAAKTLAEKRRAVTASSLADFFYQRKLTPGVQRAQARAAASKSRGPSTRRSRSQGPNAKDGVAVAAKAKTLRSISQPPVTMNLLPKRRPAERFVTFDRI